MIPIIIAAIESPEDRDLMTSFYLEYKDLLFYEASKHLVSTEDIEDTVYEALVRIIDKMDVFRELHPKQRIKYASTTVRNLSLILLKRNNLIVTVPLESIDNQSPLSSPFSMESFVAASLLKENVRTIWNNLDLPTRMLLEQKYILNWSDSEIATALSIQPQSVRMKLTRAKRRLFAHMQESGISMDDLC